MAKSNAERQRAYRANRSDRGDNGEVRFSAWVRTSTAMDVKRLALHHGCSQREILERIVQAAVTEAMRGMTDQEVDAFIDAPLRRNENARLDDQLARKDGEGPSASVAEIPRRNG